MHSYTTNADREHTRQSQLGEGNDSASFTEVKGALPWGHALASWESECKISDRDSTVREAEAHHWVRYVKETVKNKKRPKKWRWILRDS